MKINLKKLKTKLTLEQYRIAKEAQTEKPYENEYFNNFKEGIYIDVLTKEPLFSSLDKFHSGTGWPSFTNPLKAKNILTREDKSHGMLRVEVLAKKSENHLGHLFTDGPTLKSQGEKFKPTGLRYCLNSLALKFIPKNELLELGYGKYLKLFK